ncbi:aminotransferase class V-fold PLP-dependent enzyme [Candidatus Viridilinea mediisalina]|uniref:Aminotransferase V n=1 Tax=Candidatus Viridilinea mediisalina TaxID=2024553 RepID=A0A2A6RIQ5_9CHLR|nr:aminotransferase class V-fold PLP-dependent enzyme [Candidatus Viridilinea mediisalina]PDW02776.1 aminotransferase V [Candidatus Viridilinea mediisalina]
MTQTDLTTYRVEFPITERYAFLSHAAVSPLNRRVVAAVQAQSELALHTPAMQMWPQVMGMMTELRERLTTLINARSSNEIVLMPNTATGLNTVAVSLPLRAGDNVLLLDGDYPANIYPWQQLAYKGVLIKMVPQHNGGLDLERLVARIDQRTRVIALSTAMFATGFRNDIAAVGQLCKEREIYFVVDGIQTLGAFPLDVQACHIDFLAAGSQKWLLSAPGAGFLYVRQERLAELEPGAYVGASSVVDGLNYLDYNLTFPPTADRFSLGTPNIYGAAALHAALGLLQEVGIERIEQQVLKLVDALINDLSERGYTFAATTTSVAQRSGIVVLNNLPDPDAACKQLEEAGIIATVRNGLRFAPHFYNTQEEIMRVGEVLDGLEP